MRTKSSLGKVEYHFAMQSETLTGFHLGGLQYHRLAARRLQRNRARFFGRSAAHPEADGVMEITSRRFEGSPKAAG